MSVIKCLFCIQCKTFFNLLPSNEGKSSSGLSHLKRELEARTNVYNNLIPHLFEIKLTNVIKNKS